MMTDTGNSMVELLVSVAIVGLLATIAVPSYTEIRYQFYDAVALHQLHDALTAIHNFQVDEDNNDPSINLSAGAAAAGMTGYPTSWGSTTIDILLPGFSRVDEVWIQASLDKRCNSPSSPLINIAVAHCKGTRELVGMEFLFVRQFIERCDGTTSTTVTALTILKTIAARIAPPIFPTTNTQTLPQALIWAIMIPIATAGLKAPPAMPPNT